MPAAGNLADLPTMLVALTTSQLVLERLVPVLRVVAPGHHLDENGLP